MNLSSSPNSAGKRAPDEDSGYAAWLCIGGCVLGLTATAVVGGWLSNLILGGFVGYMAGALIDRARR